MIFKSLLYGQRRIFLIRTDSLPKAGLKEYFSARSQSAQASSPSAWNQRLLARSTIIKNPTFRDRGSGIKKVLLIQEKFFSQVIKNCETTFKGRF